MFFNIYIFFLIIYCFILCKHFSFCSIKTISRLLLLFQNKNKKCSSKKKARVSLGWMLALLVWDVWSLIKAALILVVCAHKSEASAERDRERAYGRGLSSCLWLHASGMTWGSEVLGGSWLGTNLRNGTLEICKMLMILALSLPWRFSLPGRSKWSVPLGILTSRPRYPWLLFNVWLLANGSRDFHQVWLQKY